VNEEQVPLEQLNQAQLIALILELRTLVAAQNVRIQGLQDQLAKHSGRCVRHS
jgi:hypothetical protein